MSIELAIEMLLSAAVAINLLLTAAIIRKLRNLDHGHNSTARLPAVGSYVDRSSVDDPVAATHLSADDSLTIFTSPGCPACADLYRQLASAAGTPLPSHTLTVVVGAMEVRETEPDWQKFGPVLHQSSDEGIGAALGKPNAYPTLVRVARGAVSATGHTLEDVHLSSDAVQVSS